MMMIPIDQIQVIQSIKLENPEFEALLTKSMRKFGFLEKYPIIVKQLNENSFELVDGYSRFKVAKRLRINEIPCKILTRRMN